MLLQNVKSTIVEATEFMPIAQLIWKTARGIIAETDTGKQKEVKIVISGQQSTQVSMTVSEGSLTKMFATAVIVALFDS